MAPKTYTIVTATGGVTGTYSGLNFPNNLRLRDTVSLLDPNNVFLTLKTSFAGGAGTGNESGRQCAGQDQ